MLELGLLPLINIPTKYNSQSLITKFSLLDQFWVSNGLQLNDAYVVPIEIADHFPVSIALRHNVIAIVRDYKVRLFNHSNNMQFTQRLNDLIPATEDEDMNIVFDMYYRNLFKVYDLSYPLVRRTISNEGNKNAEWLTPAIKACIRKKSKLYKIYLGGQIYRDGYTIYAN